MDLLINGQSYNDILLAMAKMYDQDISSIETDIQSIIEEFLAQNYIVKDDKKDGLVTTTSTSFDSNSEKKKCKLSAPIEINLYPHYICNQRCEFCYVPHASDAHAMKEADFYHILHSKGLENVMSYNILGGEPFLNINLLKYILHTVPSNKKICISTNGSSAYAPDIVNLLKEYDNLWVQVSLESGIPEEHDNIVNLSGAYDKAIQFIKTLLLANIHVSVNTVASGNNHEGIIALASELKDMGIPFLSVSLCYPDKNYTYGDYVNYHDLCNKFDYLREKLQLLSSNQFEISMLRENIFVMPEVRKHQLATSQIPQDFLQCQGGNVSIEITPNGDIFACGLMIDDSSYLLGNIFNHSFTDIWNSIQAKEDPALKIEENCISCAARWACYSACPLVRKSTKATDFCQTHQYWTEQLKF